MKAAKRNPYLLTTVTCAGPGCGRVQNGNHHWFITKIDQGAFICLPFSAGNLLLVSEQPVCGHVCAVRLFDRYLNSARPDANRKLKCGDVDSRIHTGSTRSHLNSRPVATPIPQRGHTAK